MFWVAAEVFVSVGVMLSGVFNNLISVWPTDAEPTAYPSTRTHRPVGIVFTVVVIGVPLEFSALTLPLALRATRK